MFCRCWTEILEILCFPDVETSVTMCPAGFPYLFISLGVPFFDAFNTSRLARYLGHLAEAGGVLLNDDRDEANGSGTMPSGLAVDANVTWEQPRNLRSKETFWGWKGWLVLYTTHIGLYITSCCMSIFYTHTYIYIYDIYIYCIYKSRTKWRCFCQKIIEVHGGFSSEPCLIPEG